MSIAWVVAIIYGIAAVTHNGASPFNVYDYVSFLAYIKLAVTLVKYIPQVSLLPSLQFRSTCTHKTLTRCETAPLSVLWARCT